jgi:hypothetical protein
MASFLFTYIEEQFNNLQNTHRNIKLQFTKYFHKNDFFFKPHFLEN